MTLDTFKDQLQYYFLWVFEHLYPFVHNHFVSYLLVLALFLFSAYFIWLGIEGTGKGKKADSVFLKILLIGLEVFVVAFIVWFLMVHFRTFSNRKSNVSFSEHQKEVKLVTPNQESVEEVTELKSMDNVQKVVKSKAQSIKKPYPKSNKSLNIDN